MGMEPESETQYFGMSRRFFHDRYTVYLLQTKYNDL